MAGYYAIDTADLSKAKFQPGGTMRVSAPCGSWARWVSAAGGIIGRGEGGRGGVRDGGDPQRIEGDQSSSLTEIGVVAGSS